MNRDLIIPPGEVLPPMPDPAEAKRPPAVRPPAVRPERPKRPSRKGNAVRRRFALFNAFVDLAAGHCTRAELLCWLVLYRHAGPDGTARASIGDIARRGRCDPATIRRAVKRLLAAGLLERLKRGSLAGGPSTYRLLYPGDKGNGGP